MVHDLNRRTTFDGIAQRYDEARPGYPNRLFEDIISIADLPSNGRLLEIGCGTGKATISFAQRGYAMHCLELGENMAALAARHCQPYQDVQIEVTSFEEWPLEAGAFDLVFSAQAFHWISPEIAYTKSASALKSGGHLALFWNLYPSENLPLRDRLDAIYQADAPEIANRTTSRTPDVMIAEVEDQIRDSGHFQTPQIHRYPWSALHTSEEYIRLLSTYSDHISLPGETRQRLFASIRALINGHGGTIERPYLAVLICAEVA